MAKTTGPLMSLDASGGFGGAMVFGKWKGRNTVRQLVIPANPMTTTQVGARNNVRTAGVAQHWANYNAQLEGANTESDKARITAVTPARFAWNGFLVDSMIGKQGTNMAASDTAFAALTNLQKTAWTTAADALAPAMTGVVQYMAGNVATTPKTSGHVFFNYQYGLYVMGIAPLPGAVPPTYT